MQETKGLQKTKANTLKGTIWFFIIFYITGIAGLAFPVTYPLFVKLIPFALLLSLTALLIFQQEITLTHIFLYFLIFISSFVTEAIGVKTGQIFGSYRYGDSLGLKLLDTPIMIGLNWVLLVYLTYSTLERINIAVPYKILTGTALMLLYDILLEPMAPALDMWHWEYGNIPIQNYMAWSILAIVYHSILAGFKMQTKNRLAPYILACQLSFFAVLNITII